MVDKLNAHFAIRRRQLVAIVRRLAKVKREELERLKAEASSLNRNDFIWHYLLQSFATMGRASGWEGLIGNQVNYRRLRYPVLAALQPAARRREVQAVCRAARVRMPNKKAQYILDCFEHIRTLGGLKCAKAHLLSASGREGKIQFLQTFPGIGPKYARNIMMDVYHKDFHNSIALDTRILSISKRLRVSFASYADHEAFYLEVARKAGINGWERDRILFNFRVEVLSLLQSALSASKRSQKMPSTPPNASRSYNRSGGK